MGDSAPRRKGWTDVRGWGEFMFMIAIIESTLYKRI